MAFCLKIKKNCQRSECASTLDPQASLLPVLLIITLNHLKSKCCDVKKRGDVFTFSTLRQSMVAVEKLNSMSDRFRRFPIKVERLIVTTTNFVFVLEGPVDQLEIAKNFDAKSCFFTRYWQARSCNFFPQRTTHDLCQKGAFGAINPTEAVNPTQYKKNGQTPFTKCQILNLVQGRKKIINRRASLVLCLVLPHILDFKIQFLTSSRILMYFTAPGKWLEIGNEVR